MSIRFYQLGDYDNTILRKILENQAAIIAGTETMATTGGGGGGSVSAWGDLTGTLSDQSDLQGALDGKATAGAVSALSSNALVLAEKEWPIKTVTWATNQTLTFTGGSNNDGDGVEIIANVTTQMVLTVTFTGSTVYRNGSVSALASTVTFPVGKHRLVFWTPDDGTTVYMEDTVFSAEDVPVAATPTNYTAATADVEAHLAGIDTALASGGWTSGILFTTGSTSPVIVSSITETSVFSGTVPANTLATGSGIRFSIYALYLNDAGGTSGMNFKLKFGSDVIWADSGNSVWFSTNSGSHVMLITGELKASSSTVQYGYGQVNISSALGATTGYGDATGASTGSQLNVQYGGVTSSVDSTSSQTLDFLITLTGTAGSSASHKVTVLSGMCYKL